MEICMYTDYLNLYIWQRKLFRRDDKGVYRNDFIIGTAFCLGVYLL